MSMSTFRKISKLGTNDRQPASHEEPQLGNEFGFYTREQKRRPFTKNGWTSEDESYRFPIGESPKDPWERCFEVVDRADEELYKELKDEISWLLIVASLFLGIVTAFSTMSFGWIRVDDRNVSTALLGDIVKLLNDTGAQGTVPPRDETNLNFHPHDSDIVINQMWFLSMILSLSAVIVGTLCLQWLSTFRRKRIKHRSYDDALALRQLRFEGLMGWGVPHVPGFLLLAVQGTFVLFAAGLIILLWSVNKQVAIPVVVVGGTTALFLIITTVLPLLQSVAGWIFPSTLSIPQCPYKSPISWVIHHGCVLLSIIVTLPLGLLPWFGKFLTWRSSQIELLADYTWQVFDELWRKQRECRGPQTSKTGSRNYSHYLVRGLGSAMEILVFQPHAFHIAYTCLQDFYGTTAEKEMFQDLFGKDEKLLGEILSEYSSLSHRGYDYTSLLQQSNEPRPPAFSTSHKRNIRRDFLDAHVLQHFVSHNPKLHRALLPHRVELYIRIKNSSRSFEWQFQRGAGVVGAIEGQYIGRSTQCPIRSARDAESLSSELRYQILNLAKWYLDTKRCNKADADGIKFVLEASQKLQTAYNDQEDDADEPPLKDRVKRVLKLLDEHFTEKSHHERQSSSATAFTIGEEIGGRLHSMVDQGRNDSTGSSIPVDKGPSALMMDLYEDIRDKLKEYEKRKQAYNADETPSEKRSSNVTTGEKNGVPPDSQVDQGHNDSAGSDDSAEKGFSATSADSNGVVRSNELEYEQDNRSKEGDTKLSNESPV